MTNNTIIDFQSSIKDMPLSLATEFGKSLVVAPHPDDETLGCGGTVALMLQKGMEVDFIFVSDGTMSHPNSKKYPAHKLRELREQEALRAVERLGAGHEHVTFLGLPDRSVPDRKNIYFEASVRLIGLLIARINPETIFIPWKNDPHPDHRATYEIVLEAVSRQVAKPKVLQYPIWLWELGDTRDIQMIEKLKMVCIDISSVLPAKMAALNAHQSQVTQLIDDDPEGFILSSEVISNFNQTRELFFTL